MTPSLEGLPTKAKEAPSPHEVRVAPLDTNPVFQCQCQWLGLVLHYIVFCFCISKTFIEQCNLCSNHNIFFVHFVLHHSRWKTVKGSELFEIKTEQNHTFWSLYEVFLELQGINTGVKNTCSYYSVWKQNFSLP